MKYKTIKGALFFVVLISILTACSDKEQKSRYPEYYREYNKLLTLEKNKEYLEAIKLIQTIERWVPFVPVDHLLKFRSISSKYGDCELTQHYFQQAVYNGFEYQSYNYEDDNCPALINDKIKPRSLPLDEAYKSVVMDLYKKDQAIRNSGSSDFSDTDASNMKVLLEWMEEKGYPSSDKVGRKAASKIFLVLLHYDEDKDNEILGPILDDAYHNGYLSPENYAWIIDRRRNWGNDLPPYYYQLPTPDVFMMSDEEKAEINKRRDEIGLRPLEDMNIKKTEDGGISIEITH